MFVQKLQCPLQALLLAEGRAVEASRPFPLQLAVGPCFLDEFLVGTEVDTV